MAMIQFQNRQIQLPDGSPVIVSRILGSIDGSTVQQFEEKLLGFLKQGVKHLIVVFSQVRYINSTGMGVLVKLADRFQEVGGNVNLVDVPDKLVALFNMLGLLSLIQLSKTEAEALEVFQRGDVKPKAPAPGKPAATASAGTGTAAGARPPATPPAHSPAVAAPKPPPAPAPANTQAKPQPTTAAKPQPAGGPKVVECEKCNAKVSLGTNPKPGRYKCPKCMTIFQVKPDGQVKFD